MSIVNRCTAASHHKRHLCYNDLVCTFSKPSSSKKSPRPRVSAGPLHIAASASPQPPSTSRRWNAAWACPWWTAAPGHWRSPKPANSTRISAATSCGARTSSSWRWSGSKVKPKAPFGHGRPDELTWWEAGAFALIRLRAAELGRVTAQLLDAERMLDGSPVGQPEGALSLTGPWRVRLTLADEAVLRGDPEAAVLHLRLVLRERAGQLAGLALDDVPEDLEDRLASDPELADMAQGLRLLAHVGRRMEQRRPESLGYVLPVAELMLKPLTRLCLSLSGALIRAARDEDQDGPAEEEQGGADSTR